MAEWSRAMTLSLFLTTAGIQIPVRVCVKVPSDYGFPQLTLTLLRLLSSKGQGPKDFLKPFKPCHVGIYWIALTEYSQMITLVLGFQ